MPIGLDTNILVHATVVQDREKHEKAKQLLKEIVENGDYLLSLQVIGEYYATILRVAPELAEEARELIDILATPENTVHYDLDTLNQALKITKSPGKYWDKLLALTYLRAGAQIVATENEKDFKDIITTINPLK